MLTTAEIIQARALALKGRMDPKLEADLLRRAADILDPQKKQDNFIQQRREARHASLGRFAKAMTKMNDEPLLTALTTAGYTPAPGGDIKKPTGTWIKKGTPLKIVITGDKFSAFNGDVITADALPIKDLPAFLAKPIPVNQRKQ